MASRRELFADYGTVTLAYLVVLAAALPWGNFPLNDDWVYARDAVETGRAGRLWMTGIEAAWLLPQIGLGAVLTRAAGFAHELLRAVGIVATLAAGAGLLALLHDHGADRGRRVLGLALLYFWPPLFVVGASFMSDAPFLALWIWAIVLAERALRRESGAQLAGAAALSALALLQRQFGILVPAVVGLTGLVRLARGTGQRAFAVACMAQGLALLGLFAGVYAWWSRLPHVQVPMTSFFQAASPRSVLAMLYGVLVYSGWLVLPALPWCRPRPRPGRVARLVWLGLAAVVLARVGWDCARHTTMPFWGNQISRFGLFAQREVMAGAREVVLTDPVRDLLTVGGALGGLWFLAGLSWRWGVVETTALFYLCALGARVTLFDRYLLPLLPALLIVALRPGAPAPTRWRVVAIAGAAVLAAFSWSVLFDYFQWNRARWAAGDWAVAHGVPAAAVTGGYEYDGWNRHLRPVPSGSGGGFNGLFEERDDRALIAFSAVPGHEIWRDFPYVSIWGSHRRKLFLLRLRP